MRYGLKEVRRYGKWSRGGGMRYDTAIFAYIQAPPRMGQIQPKSVQISLKTPLFAGPNRVNA